MDKEWTCIYCGHSNTLGARYCSKCNARIPDMKEFLTPQDETGDPDKETQPVEEPEEELFPIPQPGDMVGPLFRLSNAAMAGEVTPQDLGGKLRTSLENLDGAFDIIFSEIESIQTDVEDYREQVLALLENVHFMFEKGLEEMLLFVEDNDTAHLRFGRILAQRAELEYIQILEMLQIDANAPTNPFRGAPNVVGNLADQFYQGNITLEELKKDLDEFEKVANVYFERGTKFLKEGFDLARKFDGSNEEVMAAAIDRLTEAGDEISKAIINLHTQEEIKGEIVELIEANEGAEFLEKLAGEEEDELNPE